MPQNGRLAADDNDYRVMGGTSSSDNATIINSAFDPITRRLLVDNAGGSTVSVETPVGTVNGVNTSFTVTAEPLWVISDGVTYFDGAGYTYAAFGITMVIPPSSFIRAII